MKAAAKHVKKGSRWVLHLYVSNHTPRSGLAIANLQSLCERYLERGYTIRIIDIQKDPAIAIRDDIVATPALRRVHPPPQKMMIGSLTDAETVLRGLDLSRQNRKRGKLRQVNFVQAAGEA